MNTSNDITNLAKYISSLSPNELTITACLFGFLLGNDLDAYAQQSLGNFFELLGQYLLTTSSQNFLKENIND